MKNIRPVCRGFGLSVTSSKVDYFIRELESGNGIIYRDLVAKAKDITECLVIEANAKLLLYIDNGHASYYNNFHNGWEAVLTQYPSSTIDIEEASKCIAVNRYTASVFHWGLYT
jgi:hypothetical protein